MRPQSVICFFLCSLASTLATPAISSAQRPAQPESASPYELDASASCFNSPRQIDRLVAARLRLLRLQPARTCSDAVFVRRVYLDVIGSLPTAREARAFLDDRTPGKRRLLIDRLLDRDEFADYWAMRWSDVLRVKAEFPVNLWPNAAQAYHRWIHDSIRQNMPYDRFARELLTSSGSNFRVPQVNFYRAVQGRDPRSLAQAVALTFMGTRADRWPQEQLDGMAGFFSQVQYKSTREWKEEIVIHDPAKAGAATTRPAVAVFPDGASCDLDPGRDPREVFCDWLVRPDSPWFARCVVNRLWAWLLGRGIVHEPDDFRADNPPANPELLLYLERQLVINRYDLKAILRLILNSSTYQASSIAHDDDPRLHANFGAYPLRRLDAEVLLDALCQITGSSDSYTSAIPEPFTFLPAGHRAVALPDGSIGNPFLELFGRSPRDTGLDSERNNRLTSQQYLHTLNSTHVQRKLEQGRGLRPLLQQSRGRKPQEVVVEIYLTVLSRYPTPQELATAREYSAASDGSAGDAMLDLTWALINSPEFLYRH